MILQIRSIGKLNHSQAKPWANDYITRLKHYAQIDFIEFPSEEIPKKLTASKKDQILAKEAQSLLTKIPDQSHLVALWDQGKEYDSLAFSNQIRSWQQSGKNKFIFFIGGALGLHPVLLKKVHQKLRLSSFTLAHELALVVFLEQLYRAHTILRNEPYHK